MTDCVNGACSDPAIGLGLGVSIIARLYSLSVGTRIYRQRVAGIQSALCACPSRVVGLLRTAPIPCLISPFRKVPWRNGRVTARVCRSTESHFGLRCGACVCDARLWRSCSAIPVNIGGQARGPGGRSGSIEPSTLVDSCRSSLLECHAVLHTWNHRPSCYIR